jgi:hypothetical protein
MSGPGLPDGMFSNQKNAGPWNEKVGIFHLEYISLFYGNLVI